MSRQIDLTKRLSEEDVAYLKERGADGEARLTWNAKYLRDTGQLGDNDAEEDEDLSEEEKATMLAEATTWVNKAKLEDLREKAAEWELDTSGTKDELKDRILEAVNKEYAPSAI